MRPSIRPTSGACCSPGGDHNSCIISSETDWRLFLPPTLGGHHHRNDSMAAAPEDLCISCSVAIGPPRFHSKSPFLHDFHTEMRCIFYDATNHNKTTIGTPGGARAHKQRNDSGSVYMFVPVSSPFPRAVVASSSAAAVASKITWPDWLDHPYICACLINNKIAQQASQMPALPRNGSSFSESEPMTSLVSSTT